MKTGVVKPLLVDTEPKFLFAVSPLNPRQSALVCINPCTASRRGVFSNYWTLCPVFPSLTHTHPRLPSLPRRVLRKHPLRKNENIVITPPPPRPPAK